jgi:alpha-L-fucosidase
MPTHAQTLTPLDGPPFGPRPTPSWYRDAKLGIFIHWGLYSIPAFAPRTGGDFTSFMRDLTAMKDTRGQIPYAEWYLNSLRVPGSETARHHASTYGRDFSYFDFRSQFEASARRLDVDEWARLFANVGARYVVLVTRHLDGYPLWPTRIANPRMPADFRSSRDLVGDVTRAVRARGLRMGLYYAGGIDWTFVDKPIRTLTDLMEQQALGSEYARYAAAQWQELIQAYAPSILWNDMGWPADSDPRAIFTRYYDTVSDGLVNDRWLQTTLPRSGPARALYLQFIGIALRVIALSGRALPTPRLKFPYDIETHEYAPPDSAIPSTWELTRGLGKSFGYNAQETAADALTGTALIHLLVDVVSKGGNLLLNVGPDGQGRIPEIQLRPLRELGAWLQTNGQAIFDTRACTRSSTLTAEGQPVRFTQRNGTEYLIVLGDQVGDTVIVRDLTAPSQSHFGLLGVDGKLTWRQHGSDVAIQLPRRAGAAHAYVLTMQSAAESDRAFVRLH